MDDQHPSPGSSRRLVLAAVVVVAGLGAGGAYVANSKIDTLSQEAAHCGQPGCAKLAEDAAGLRSELADIHAKNFTGQIATLEGEVETLTGKIGTLEGEIGKLRENLATAIAERNSLGEQVAFCGADGCAALHNKLLTAEGGLQDLEDHKAKLVREMAALRDKLATTESGLKDLEGSNTQLSQDVATLRDKLAAAETGLKDVEDSKAQLGQEVAALQDKLALVEKDRDELQAKNADMASQQGQLRQQMAELEKKTTRLERQLADEFSKQEGRQITLVELLRIGPFDIGSFQLSKDKLTKVEQALRPHKTAPLLVVGVADKTPFSGPSSHLKQLGLMLARARLVEEMGYQVYYQVRQSDPQVPNSRGIVVYKLDLGPASPAMAEGGAPIPTFYRSRSGQAG